jgi:hypothetical protein
MMKCWREDPQERPQFAELVKTVEDMLGVGMDYLDLGCLAGVSNREYFMNSQSDGSLPKGIFHCIVVFFKLASNYGSTRSAFNHSV